jgi:hypothetical protein
MSLQGVQKLRSFMDHFRAADAAVYVDPPETESVAA